MRKLAMQIAKGLETSNFWAVNEQELIRVWPDAAKRQKAIIDFAKRYGWRVRHYEGKCVVFEKESSSA